MVELAIVLPVMMVLFLGSWTATDLIGDNDTAIQATRAGARNAAELGNGGYPAETLASCQTSGPGSTFTPQAANPCAVDQDIIQQMLPIVTGNMPNAVVNEIDIYEPSGGGCGTFSSGSCPPNNGAYIPGEPINVYPISGTTVTLPSTYSNNCTTIPLDCYTLNLRDQTHPDESELGVRIIFTYTSPTLKMFTQQDSRYTVVRLAPVE
jgi:hypothetical protein